MYLKQVALENVKSIKSLKINFPSPFFGWHVLLGENGSGKSTILKSISLCLLGERQGYALKENLKNWITRGESGSSCRLDIILDNNEDSLADKYNGQISLIQKIDTKGNLETSFIANGSTKRAYPNSASKGWYSAAFGPYRRLGEKDTKSIEKISDGNLENHITLFDANYNLTSATQWLMDLKFEKLNNDNNANIFDDIVFFINNSKLLPNDVKIESVNHEGVYFKDGNNKDIEINDLSDGYQSIISLIIEILRQISKRVSVSEIFKKTDAEIVIAATGIVLIDEIDIHLHPQWQSQIGEWFKKYFPKIQFIVSTHSPIVCQSAEGATIWKIEHMKNDRLTKRITGQDYKRMVYGSLTDSISTDSFGIERIERSQKSSELLDRLAVLNVKSIGGEITKKEQEELKTLKSILPSEK